MERYGRSEGTAKSDPLPEWTSTGLEEPMWKMGLGDGSSYPERPEEADCIYYLRTGYCGYGPRCRFNHPRDRTAVALRAGRGEYPERVGQPLCQYYMRTGMCKFGASCKYNHPRQGGAAHVSVNYSGYPLRPGEKECTFYMKTGQCKFGTTCKFHHPQPDGTGIQQIPAVPPGSGASPVPQPTMYSTVQSPYATPSQQYGVMGGNWHAARPPPLLQGPYIPGYGPVMLSPGMVPIAGWSPYPAPLNSVASPSAQQTVGPGQFYGITQLSPSAPAYMGAYPQVQSSSVAPSSSSSQKEQHAYPERPGQPECQFFMKTGECKYGSSCRYNHPQELITSKTNVVLSPMNLPLRPGSPSCSYFAQHGVCKFGPTCKYDHPMGGPLSYSPSASSLADMPVAPYPVGSSLATSIAPSSSSTEQLQPQLTTLNRMSSSSLSSMTTSSSVGSILSKGDQTST